MNSITYALMRLRRYRFNRNDIINIKVNLEGIQGIYEGKASVSISKV